MPRDNEWMTYYDAFEYFVPGAVRDGCHPRLMEHPGQVEHAVVLVHGLSDSPYYLTAIGEVFFNKLHFNVYLPLLQCHGLLEPEGMENVQLEEWKRNVAFAVQCAAEKAATVSIGGLSTGGTLGFHSACRDTRVNGGLYLFSAALDLAGGPGGFLGELKERLLRTSLSYILDRDRPLIGPNPYRYSHVDIGGARELSRLIKETDAIMKELEGEHSFQKSVFAAHSEADETASLAGVERLQRLSLPGHFTLFKIPKALGVSHASVVLRDPVFAVGAGPDEEPLEKANPLFSAMMDSIMVVASGDSNG